VVRRNAGVSIGDRVSVQRVDCPNADAITIAPIYAGSARMDLGPGLESFVSKALQRRPFVRFFACSEDLSHESPDAPLPEAVASGAEPFLLVGAIAGGYAGAHYAQKLKPKTMRQVVIAIGCGMTAYFFWKTRAM
jgi:hypothetical protein